MDKAAIKLQLNLKTLTQQIDASIYNILDSSSHVVLYSFNSETSQWSKLNTEGTLFVFVRNTAPNCGFCIINRLSIENLVVYLDPTKVNLTMMGDYVIYKIGDSIHGLWMYEQKDRERLLKCMSTSCQNTAPSFQQPVPAAPPIVPNGGGGDIMGLLNRAAMMHQQQQQQQAALYPASNSLYSPSMPSEQLPQQQAAPSPAPPQLRISSLNDLWSLLDYNPSTGQITSSSLDMNSFQARLYEKLQDPVVMSALFSNYKNQIG